MSSHCIVVPSVTVECAGLSSRLCSGKRAHAIAVVEAIKINVRLTSSYPEAHIALENSTKILGFGPLLTLVVDGFL